MAHLQRPLNVCCRLVGLTRNFIPTTPFVLVKHHLLSLVKCHHLLIKNQGDWKSEAYQAYIDIPLSTKWDMLKLMTDSVK